MKDQEKYKRVIKTLIYASTLMLVLVTVGFVTKKMEGETISEKEFNIPEKYTYENLLIEGMGHLGKAMQNIQNLQDAQELVELFNQYMETRSGFFLPEDICAVVAKAEFLARTQTGPQIEEAQLVEALHKSIVAALFLKTIEEIEPLAISTTRWVLPNGEEVGMGAWYPWPSTKGMRQFFEYIPKSGNGLIILNRLSPNIKTNAISLNDNAATNSNFAEGALIISRQTLLTFSKSALENLTHINLSLVQKTRRTFASVHGLMMAPDGSRNLYPADALFIAYTLATGDLGVGESFFARLREAQIETWETTLGERPYGDQGFVLVRPIKVAL